MYIDPHVKYPLIFSEFSENWTSSADFWKTLEYQISWKSVLREPRCFMRTENERTGRQDERG